jgi:hypothetical protein
MLEEETTLTTGCGSGLFLFEGLNKQSVSVKLTGKFIGTQNKLGKTTVCMDNLWLLNEENREPNKKDPESKGTRAIPTVPAEYNLTLPTILVLRNCYFNLDLNRGLIYVVNHKWKDIHQQDYMNFFKFIFFLISYRHFILFFLVI